MTGSTSQRVADDGLESLNPQQRRAVVHTGGPLLVVAGAGTGKTSVIVHRLSHLVTSGRVPAARIIAVTFTNKAARELQERTASLIGNQGAKEVRLGTFHWLAHRLLRRYGSAIEIGSNFQLLTPAQSMRVLKSVVRSYEDTAGQLSLPEIRDAVSAFRNQGRGGSPRADVTGIAPSYERELRRNRLVDLDGLILESARLLEEKPSIRSAVQRGIGHILVDEYQDINASQERLIRLMVGSSGEITAVGDDDQAIYGWRHADVGAFLAFPERYPNTTIIRLEQNYRSTRRILQPANLLLTKNQRRMGKELFSKGLSGRLPEIFVAGDESEEAHFAVSTVKSLLAEGTGASDIGILFRINAQSRVLEERLIREGIEYQVRAGRRFYERPEVARIIDCLRAGALPETATWLPLLQHVPGIGARRSQLLLARATDLSSAAFETAAVAVLPGGVAQAVISLIRGLSEIRSTVSLEGQVRVAADVMERTAGLVGVNPADVEAAKANISEFESAARQFDHAGEVTLNDFLDRLALVDRSEADTGVQLMTLHAAKGLEFHAVIIIGVEDGLIPHARSLRRVEDLEEERRLLYVGMTRAKNRLYLTYAHGRSGREGYMTSTASRFLDEMPRQLFKVTGAPKDHPRDRLARVARGETVQHPRWGLGRVAKVEGKGRDTMVTIAFRDGTQQKVQLCHAPLRRVSRGVEA